MLVMEWSIIITEVLNVLYIYKNKICLKTDIINTSKQIININIININIINIII